MKKQTFTLLLLALGWSATGESTSVRAARAVSPTRPFSGTRVLRYTRRTRRGPARVQYITSEPSQFAAAPVTFVQMEPKKHYFSGMVVQVASGLNAGYAISNSGQTGATRNAMAFSVMVEKKLTDTFYLSTELAYVPRGVNANLMSLGTTSIVGSVQLNYLEVPLLLKTKFRLTPRLKVFFVGGPSVGLILSRQVEVLGLVNLDLGNRFNQVDLGLVLGTGLEYSITPDLAIVGHLRNQIGLVNLEMTPGATFYTRGIQLLLGAQFKL
jgi:hypothetical protein